MVAGLEPECTNSFLLALANAASDSNIDNHEAVRRCLEGEEPGSGAPPKKVNHLSFVMIRLIDWLSTRDIHDEI